jgi:hypothetical protein
MPPCAVTCFDGFLHCDVDLLLRRSPLLRELFSGVSCYCTGPGLALPDISVHVVALAVNLLLAEEGVVTVEYESLLAAVPFFELLGIPFNNDIEVTVRISTQKYLPPPPDACGGGGEVDSG